MSKRLLFPARFSLLPLHILLSPALPSARRLHKVPFARRSSTYPERNIASLLARSPASASLGVEQSGGTIRINGFVRTVRKQKRVAFAAVGDGSSLESLQVVLNPEQAEGLSTGVAVAITGQWKPSPAGKEQTHELHAEEVQILGQHDVFTYPLQKKYHTPEFLRSLPHLRPRLPFNSLLLRLRSQLISQLTEFFSNQGFVQTHPPIITSSDCEGAGEVFAVSTDNASLNPKQQDGSSAHEELFFHSPKYLTVSSQLHLEALAQSVGKVWTLSPTFRAEKSDTPRHLSEFYMLEAEIAFAERLDEIMDLVEDMLRAVALGLKASHVGQELLHARASSYRSQDPENSSVTQEVLLMRWEGFIYGPWPRITYVDAINKLEEAVVQDKIKFEFAPSFHSGLQAEHEKFLAETVGQGGPIFITDYPRALKPFYMAPSTDRTGSTGAEPTVACFDLLVPEVCELAGGSMREHRLSQLLESMDDRGLKRSSQFTETQSTPDAIPAISDDPRTLTTSGSLQWYLDLRRYGSVPHGGFGLGFDRLVGYLSGVSSIRDVVGFPRWYGRCEC